MTRPDLYRALVAIGRCDPDGSPDTEPTEALYAAHERWAVATYGETVWETYCRHDWVRLDPSRSTTYDPA